jgi:hypothetical protein
MSNDIEKFINDFGYDYLNKEVSDWVERNDGNGLHRIIAVIDGLKREGKTEFQIAKIIKEMNNK